MVSTKNNDVKTYKKLLDEVFKKYKKLTPKYKKAFLSFNTYKRDYLYNLVCMYSLKNDKKNALKYLKKAIHEGFIDYEHLKNDTDLDNIRNYAEFKILVNPLKTYYLSILKKGKKYNFEDKRELPKFIYQRMDNQNLVKLRKEYNLDSIAGNGNEISKILNLMHWVHNIIKHNGSSENPEIQNAKNIISVCKREDRGVNCRMLAIVLNECYLAMGIKSKYITCMPREEVFEDCHVINMVYSKDLKKWLWIDPTFEAYVMDENGNMLSIQEVRERLVLNKPLILNSDANWNNKIPQTKEHYLDTYMAKNLYRIQAPVISEFDFETATDGKTKTYIELLPTDYFKQKPNVIKSLNEKKEIISLNYITNNPTLFWAEPTE
ncbi:transglutaminase domain-containing protein [Polaribacter glomeratus]|nr:transglutaminase domain-containing protein [Polaribacter glomeratus]